MASDPTILANAMHDAQGQKPPVSDEEKGLAEAIIEHFKQTAIVNFLPQSVNGTCPSGGPLSGGTAAAGLITGPNGPGLATLIASKTGKGAPTPQLIGFANGITTHVMTGKVNFAAGKVTGQCTNSPSSPGPVIGQGTGGKIVGLSDAGMAQLISSGIGQASVSDVLRKTCAAICDHFQQQSEILLPPASVQGTAPSGGGPLVAGVASGGKFT